MHHLLLLLFIAYAAVLLLYGLRRVKARYCLLSAMTGVLTLLGTDFLCSLFQSGVPVTPFTLAVSAVGGVPGALLVNALHLFLR